MTADRHLTTSDAATRVFDEASEVARAAAGEFVLRLLGIQASRGSASVVLTGGGVGTAMLAAVAEDPDADRVDWSQVSVWWGDERFLPTEDPDRNETAARQVLLDKLPDLASEHVHPMPAAGGRHGGGYEGGDGGNTPTAADVAAAASAYAAELADAAGDPAIALPGQLPGVPHFDVVLLGVGPDGHVASVFPERPDADPDAIVVAVTDSPKPPPNRVSLTLSVLNTADEVWLLATGAEKAGAVASARNDPGRLPASRVHGTKLTRWWLDAAAAGG